MVAQRCGIGQFGNVAPGEIRDKRDIRCSYKGRARVHRDCRRRCKRGAQMRANMSAKRTFRNVEPCRYATERLVTHHRAVDFSAIVVSTDGAGAGHGGGPWR
jgi:hypothetical protein